jgi:ribonuclease J
MSEPILQAIPLGGLGEFGMNMMVLRYGDDIIVIDCGLMFPEAELLGVDVVVPDITYLLENREFVRAIVLTHGHEDHIGGLPFVLNDLNVPVYGTPFTLALAERRLEEHGLLDKVDLREVHPKQTIEIGPFKIEFIHVTHSIIAAVMLAITTPLGVIMHTGDFKVDPTPTDNELFDLHTVAEYGKRGVLALFSDSTNVDRRGFTPSERAVRRRFEEVFQSAENRIFVSCFTSSVHRLQLAVDLSVEHGRKVALIGRSMNSVAEIAHRMGYLTIPDGVLLRPQDIASTPRNKLMSLIAGSQGEPMSALSRAAVDNHRQAQIDAGDTVVLSSRIIPGNEKPIYRMINHLFKRGADVVYEDYSGAPIHVSGHASQEELLLILNLVKPKYFVPMHGEYRQQFRHAQLASHLKPGLKEIFIIEDGDILQFDAAGARKAGRVRAGRRCIDSGSGDEVAEDQVVRDRRHLSEDGIVLPVLAINKLTGVVETPPEIISRGFVSDDDEEGGLLVRARDIVRKTLEGSSEEEKSDYGVIKEKIRTDLKRFFKKETSKRPMVLPVILEI